MHAHAHTQVGLDYSYCMQEDHASWDPVSHVTSAAVSRDQRHVTYVSRDQCHVTYVSRDQAAPRGHCVTGLLCRAIRCSRDQCIDCKQHVTSHVIAARLTRLTVTVLHG